MHCCFCHDIHQENKLLETTHFFLIYDHDPIQSGHLLLISKDHIENISALTNDALNELIHLEKILLPYWNRNYRLKASH
nr:HIT domain-containing protein [Vagococcus allomyrinae]